MKFSPSPNQYYLF